MIDVFVSQLSDIDLRQAFKEIHAFRETKVWVNGIVRSVHHAYNTGSGSQISLETVEETLLYEMGRRTYGAKRRWKTSTEQDYIAVLSAGNDYITALRQLVYPRNDDVRDFAWEQADFLGTRYFALLDTIKVTEKK